MSEEILVPPQHWADLKAEDMKKLCDRSLAVASPANGLILSMLEREILVDREEACIKIRNSGSWEKVTNPLLELLILVYLLNAGTDSLQSELISVQELKVAHFFQGPHELKTDPLLKRYGNDLNGFRQAAEYLNGESKDMADAAYKLSPFPRVNLYFLLWQGDEEFPAQANVLLDRPIENILAADAIWAMINRVITALVEGPGL